MADETTGKIAVSYQGIKGSYSHQASVEYFEEASFRGHRSFYEAMKAVREGDVDYAVIPVENSTAGRVMGVYNLLPKADLHIIGEYMLPIEHCLVVPHNSFRGAPSHEMAMKEIIEWKQSPLTDDEIAEAVSQIREVQSHPQALEQCRDFLAENVPAARVTEVYDTASSARDIASRHDAEIAAISSKKAAEAYNVLILEEGIEDIKGNTTRFLILAREPLKTEEIKGPTMTTLLFETSHEPGSLYRALRVFEEAGVSLTKLETYMSGTARPSPSFYIDVGANILTEQHKNVMEELEKHTHNLHVLGVYEASPLRGDGKSFLPAQ